MDISNFKKLELEDKNILDKYFRADPPQCSELTFTNLFMWRHKNNPLWAEYENCLLLILQPEGHETFGLEPVGKGNKKEALDFLFKTMDDFTGNANVCRVSERFVEEFVDRNHYESTIDRNNCDYVYNTIDLINLSGRKFHRKKNHVNRFLKNYDFKYRELDSSLIEKILDMQEKWCMLRECAEDPSLQEEDFAIHQALSNYESLDFKGGAIEIDSKIEAFSLGEMLDEKTAVIHIEKANPEIPGLYTVINQFFCKNAWHHTEFINREQENMKEQWVPFWFKWKKAEPFILVPVLRMKCGKIHRRLVVR